MERERLDAEIAAVSKSIFSYCISRTSCRQDAEDLAQDILYEIIKSAPTLRDERAFYRFMWSIAENTCKQWYRKKQRIAECELPDGLVGDDGDFTELEDGGDIFLLRRELSLLSKKYRDATILYYLKRRSCAEISQILSISESMVKHLLFKSRKILKEGMNMERSYGEQSYNPGTLNIMYLGEGPNRYWSLINGNRIRQNILLACYNDSLTEEEVALQIGVSLPYIESDIKTLTEVRLLKKEGKRYRTDIIILTGELESEKASRLLPVQNETAKKLRDFIDANEDAIRSVGFYKNDMSLASLKWHMVTMMLYNAYSAVGDKFISNEDCPVTAFGEHARIWGVESIRDGFNCCIINANEWKTGISLFFMDWSARPELQHNDFYGNVMQVSVFDKIAHGNTGGMTELEQELAAEMIRKGYVINGSGALRSAMPVYTKEQLAVMQELQRPVVEEIVALFNRLYREIAAVLENHVPPQLKAQVNAIAAMSLFNDGTYIPAAILNKNGYLSTDWTPNELATSYAVLE